MGDGRNSRGKLKTKPAQQKCGAEREETPGSLEKIGRKSGAAYKESKAG